MVAALPLSVEGLVPGEVVTITAIDRAGLDPATAMRLHELGFDEGVDVELLHRAPFGGDPLALRVGNMVVALRRSMARLIEVGRFEDELAADTASVALAAE